MGETANTLHVLKNRRLILQVAIDEGALPGSGIDPDPIHRPENVSSGGTTPEKTSSTRFIHTTPFDSSMVLTVLVLLTALFFMGFFSLYIRRFSQEDPSEFRRRRHSSPPALLRQNQKRGGVDSSTVRALPTVPYRGGANQLIADCSICLSEFEEGETVKLIPHCRHVFHSPCLDTWLASHVSCPLCRGTQFFETAGGRDRDEVVVRLDVVAEEGSGRGGRPTVDGCDTWRGEMMRRTGSSANLVDRPVVLHRSFSF